MARRSAAALVPFALLLASALGALEVPFLAGRVNDLAGMLDPDEVARLEQALAAFEQETGAQVAVLTVPSLEGEEIEDFAIRVVETWELGRQGVDDGALLLVARDERRLRIEVGYGLEGVLTDAASRRILDRVITPHFRQGDFGGGIEAGVGAMLATIRGEELPAPARGDRRVLPGLIGAGCSQLLLLVFLLVVISVVSRASRRGGRRTRSWSSRGGGWTWTAGSAGGGRGFSGGSSGGGGFSGGGGSFGGGGASGSW
ncbi:MAG TPA: TPM domain-containing protein [Thermoanaerobaculia bacterium]|nr:TPM domain-containing protein [Thermoanaerobaculia bacterium]